MKKKYILVLSEGPTNGLDATTTRAEALHYANISKSRKKICKDLHHNGASRFSYGNGVKV